MGSITVSNLGKAYKQYPNRWSRLVEWIMPGGPLQHQLKWVLQDINFIVKPGEAVGIIGKNGAGKSTLLKLITGTALPTQGMVTIQGRVAAMLELGMGFHPDFTGRENVLMAAQLLGIDSEGIQRLMPVIEAFSEIGDYIDQPVRVYSSGMQMRLAFSVATAIRPDVLIVDEALSVGDAYFQHKSFDLIREFREQGTTLLIVSHDKQAIQSICDRAILLAQGQIIMEGNPESVMDYYNAMLADHQEQKVKQNTMEDGKVQTISGTGEATISEVNLCNLQGGKLDVVNVGDTVCIHVAVTVHQPLAELVLGYMIKDRLGQPIFGTNTFHYHQTLIDVVKGQKIDFKFQFDANIGPGHYSVALALHSRDTHIEKNYEWRDFALVFNVINLDKPEFVGVAWLAPQIVIHS
jgi:lipopolysaccharide transport system ATP-binding protein